MLASLPAQGVFTIEIILDEYFSDDTKQKRFSSFWLLLEMEQYSLRDKLTDWVLSMKCFLVVGKFEP